MTSEKSTETRLRRAARRQGLQLVKSRTRDWRAFGHGRYMLVDAETNVVIHGTTIGSTPALALDDVEGFLDEFAAARTS